MAYEEDLY